VATYLLIAMRIIRVQPSQRFFRFWEAAEGDGPQPAFRHRNDAITYAKGRFSRSRTEIHVYDYDGKEVVEKITLNGRSRHGESNADPDAAPD